MGLSDVFAFAPKLRIEAYFFWALPNEKSSFIGYVLFAKNKNKPTKEPFMKHQNISIESTTQTFSAHSGLFLLDRIFKELQMKKRIKKALPPKKKNKAPSQVCKFKALLFSFAIGGDSLSDIDTYKKDILFSELTESCAARTVGDFLKSFAPRHAELLQELLIELAYELRCKFYPEDKKCIISMDATPHEHYSKKMEGMAWNYKNMWCLDSQNAYDQYGFSYCFDLRAGNTHSCKGAEHWVHQIFSRCPDYLEKWFRADSAYGTFSILESLEIKKVKFAIVLRDNLGRYVRKKNKSLLDWKKSDLYFFDSGECEVAMGLYPVKNWRVVFIRKRKTSEELEKQAQQDMFSAKECTSSETYVLCAVATFR